MMPDVTPTQFAVLARLRDTGPVSQNQLGRRVGMDAATTKGVIDRLRTKGFVRSFKSQTDMRRHEIALTDAGRTFADTAVGVALEISQATTANLTRREQAQLLALLDKL